MITFHSFYSQVRQVMRNLSHQWMFGVSSKIVFMTAILSIIIIFFKWKNIPPQVPLWYFQPWGNDRLANPVFLFIYPISTVIIHIVNIIFAALFLNEHRVFAQALFVSSLFIAFLSIISVFKILFLIT